MPPISDEIRALLEACSNEWKEQLRPENEEDVRLVQKGLLLYRQGLVSKLRIEQDAVTATVQDVIPVFVSLDLNFLQMSSCTCPTNSYCRHQLAAFFQAYASIGSVATWVEEWRTPIRERQSAQKWGLERAKDLLKKTGSQTPDYDRWVSAFTESFQTIMKGKKYVNPYLIPELFQVYKRKLQAAAPFEQEWKQLYMLIAYIHSFRMLFQLSIELYHDEEEMDRYYRHVFQRLFDDIESNLNRLNTQALPFSFDPFMEKLKDDCIELLTGENELLFERLDIYRLIWTGFFKKKSWREKEVERLKSRLAEEKENLPLVIGLIHLHFLLGEDTEALALISRIHTTAAPYFLYWLKYLEMQKEWQRMALYIDQFTSIISDYLQELPNLYARFDFSKWALKAVAHYCDINDDVGRYEKMLLQTLPFSASNYEVFLIDQKDYQKWSSLMTFMGIEISSLPKDTIQTITKEAPAVLLPLYHQSIQKNIELKNRGNYRVAVRQLKKLRTLYKKLKRTGDWESFFDQLQLSTKRLRAFQEECQRGKLIDA